MLTGGGKTKCFTFSFCGVVQKLTSICFALHSINTWKTGITVAILK